ncbi:hypothetical protein ROZALSC1DRAFT_28447, partial [Rozella allomycis CSF55]
MSSKSPSSPSQKKKSKQGSRVSLVVEPSKLGLFSEVGYLQPKTFVPLHSHAFLNERTKGAQMKGSSRKLGKTKDAFFDKDFVHIFENEAYCDY